jgi:hypothetical protein
MEDTLAAPPTHYVASELNVDISINLIVLGSNVIQPHSGCREITSATLGRLEFVNRQGERIISSLPYIATMTPLARKSSLIEEV